MTKDHDITSLLSKVTVFKIVNLNCTKHNLSYVIITNPIVEHLLPTGTGCRAGSDERVQAAETKA